MRDDTVTVRGPFEVPPLHVPERREGTVVVAAHTLDMSHMRRFELDTYACPCGYAHGYTVLANYDEMIAYPQMAEWLLESSVSEIRRSIESCEGRK